MAERLADLNARMEAVRQLSLIVTAMRAVAAARASEARDKLSGMQAYARMVSSGIGAVLAIIPAGAQAQPDTGKRVLVALGPEHGFVGAFNTRIVEAVLAHRSRDEVPLLLVAGSRAASALRERGVEPDWHSPMASHADQAAALAGRIVDEIYRLLANGAVREVTLLHGRGGQAGALEIAAPRLIPMDFTRFAPRPERPAPLLTEGTGTILARLAEEYVFAEVCQAVALSFAAENEARLRAMTAAHGHIGMMLDDLTARARRLRQEEITNEIVGLAVSRAQAQ